jgi:hypothetical protein
MITSKVHYEISSQHKVRYPPWDKIYVGLSLRDGTFHTVAVKGTESSNEVMNCWRDSRDCRELLPYFVVVENWSLIAIGEKYSNFGNQFLMTQH